MNRKHIRNGLIGAALVLLAAAALARGWDAPSLLPFEAEEISEIEMYQYIVPAATQKKTVSGPNQIAQVCRRIAAASVQPRTDEQSYTGGETTIFRFHLQDQRTFEICFTEPHFVGAPMVLCIRPRPILAVYGKPWMSPPSPYRKMNCSEAKEGNGNPFPFIALSHFPFSPAG